MPLAHDPDIYQSTCLYCRDTSLAAYRLVQLLYALCPIVSKESGVPFRVSLRASCARALEAEIEGPTRWPGPPSSQAPSAIVVRRDSIVVGTSALWRC
ncbi:hypothetical protein NPIL_691961 [Nephila pilipes]|uniref:Uncharacterized protein n=1 Tax=Nephila pilipes TaxID=299642 RepID=A0A8X6P091_NEPPI|nr:hypothetical protein NPIL_691961 [Nephila pilipes]